MSINVIDNRNKLIAVGDDPLREMEILTNHSKVSTALYINPAALRPCVALMRSTSFQKGSAPNRSKASCIIASEMVSVGFTQERIEETLLKWNQNNEPPLPAREVMATIRTAIRKRYRFSCHNGDLKQFCAPDMCIHAKEASYRRYNFRDFFIYSWQLILSNVAKDVYWIALPELEKRKGLKPGDRICENHKEIATLAGISRKHVKKALEELARYGLIAYTPGAPRKWESKATEVSRLLPIPKPPKTAILKVTKDT